MKLEDRLIEEFTLRDPSGAARSLEALPVAEIAAVLESLGTRGGPALLESLSPHTAVQALEALPPARAARLLAEMPARAATFLLRRAHRPERERLLKELPRRVAEPVRRLLDYPERSVGALMDPLAACVPEDSSIESARALVDRRPPEALYYVYVVDREQKLTGVLTLKRLMLNRPAVPVGEVMSRDVVSLSARTGVAALHRHDSWHDLDALPVIDERGRFVGAIRHRDLRRIAADARAPGDPWGGGAGLLQDIGETYWLGLYALIRSAFRDPAPAAEHHATEP